MTVSRRQIRLGIVGAAVFAAMAFGWWKWDQARRFSDIHTLLTRFPVEDAIVLNIDFASVRRAGLLTGSKAPLEPEYKQFLDGTGFDYHRDLDTVTASFSKSGNFFVARGRFDWAKLRDYAAQQGGSCYDQLCRMQGSQPERRPQSRRGSQDFWRKYWSGSFCVAAVANRPARRCIHSSTAPWRQTPFIHTTGFRTPN